jgi:hypothetical protein
MCLSLLAVMAGCASSPQARIERNWGRYETYPLEVRERIAAGQVDVGFTAEMVQMALGEPARVAERRTENETTEVWIYTRNRPRFGIGIGVGSFGGRTGVSTGVGVSTGGWGPVEVRRVEFRDGVVVAVDHRTR